MRGQNEKTKQNQTETAVTELIDQVEKFFSTRRFGSSTSTAAIVISAMKARFKHVVVRNLAIAKWGSRTPR